MSPEQINIAIAKACGWKWWTGHWGNRPSPQFRFLSRTGEYNEGHLEGILATDADMKLREISGDEDPPNYHGDLNAMHEAEKVLTQYQKSTYRSWLYEKCDENGYLFATSAQRAEAFLRTLGLWEEKP